MAQFFRDTIDWALARKAVIGAGQAVALKATEYLAERVRQNAPVDTGFLVSTVEIVGGKSALNYHVVVTAPYAQPVEFGHVTKGGGWVAPNPFFRNAVYDTVRAFPQIASTVSIVTPHADPMFGVGSSQAGQTPVVHDAKAQHFGAAIPKR